MKRIVIIGGGTAGLFSAILLKKNCPDYEVMVLERLERVGKKILATGNGRCNFSNVNVEPTKYNNPMFVTPFIKNVDSKNIISIMEELGLVTTIDSEGRIYPYSESANSFLDILRINMKTYGVIEKCNFEVSKISKTSGKVPTYIIEDTRKQVVEANYVILAAGGKASPVLGSNGTGYNLLKPWHVKVTPIEPGLVGVKVDAASIKGLSGLRVKAKVSLFDKKAKQKVWSEWGEVLFKDDGLSGIVIMQMASVIARSNISKANNNYYFELDLMPQYDDNQLIELLLKRKDSMKTLENSEFLNGMLMKVLGFNIIKRSKLDLSQYIGDLSNRDIIRLSSIIKNYSLEYKGLYNFDRAQVTVGGIDLSEVDKKTLELLKLPNVYACGEILDVDGECGGYNMHFALASAYAVANAIKEKCEQNE